MPKKEKSFAVDYWLDDDTTQDPDRVDLSNDKDDLIEKATRVKAESGYKVARLSVRVAPEQVQRRWDFVLNIG